MTVYKTRQWTIRSKRLRSGAFIQLKRAEALLRYNLQAHFKLKSIPCRHEQIPRIDDFPWGLRHMLTKDNLQMAFP